MSKPIFTPDLGIIAPKTIAPAGGKVSGDPSFTADAFEGALSNAVARQRDEDVKAQQAQRAKASQDAQKYRDRSEADQSSAPRQDQTDASTAPAKDAVKAPAQKNAKSASARRDEIEEAKQDARAKKGTAKSADPADEEVISADVTSDAGAIAVADESFDSASSDAGGDQASADQPTDATDIPDATQVVAAVVIAPTVAAAPTPVDASSTSEPASPVAAATPEGEVSPAPSNSDPLNANPAPAAAAPTADAGQANGASAAAGSASDDLQTPPAATQSAASDPAPSAPQSPALAPQNAPAPQAAPAQATSPAPARPAANQVPAQDAATPSIAAQAAAAQAAAAQAATQAAAQSAAGAPAQPASAPAAAKPFIPAESSSVASLKNAIDIPTTVTYTASAPSASQNGSAAGFGGSNGGGAGLGGNANNQTAVPVRAAGAAAIVAQDVGQAGQAAFEEILAAAAPEALASEPTAADDLPVVDTKSSSTQPTTNAQTLANRLAFDAPGAQQGAPAARTHHVLLPLANQVTAGMAKLAQSGGGEINIHLQPANLGRVDVSMKIADDGRMTATITADRQDTLDLLRRDAHALERSLADAGLRTDDGGLQFSLRGEGGQRDRDTADSRGGRPLAQIADPEPIQASPTRRASSLSRLDMRI